MASYLMKNGVAVCDLVLTPGRPFPTKKEDCWHDCVLVTAERVVARPADTFGIVTGGVSIPFLFSRCRVAVEGWEVEGQVLV